MKLKSKIFLLLISICILFSGCNLSLNNSKPSNYYYTDQLYKDLMSSTKHNIYIVDTNFYKKITLNKEEENAVNGFMKNLSTKYFISKPKDIPNIPKYKMYFTFQNSKYVINVYNEKYICIFPWDGQYSIDYADISKVPLEYNLFSICNYIYTKQQ